MSATRTTQMSVRVTPALLARLDALAKAKRWSRSATVEVAVEEWVAAQERQMTAKKGS